MEALRARFEHWAANDSKTKTETETQHPTTCVNTQHACENGRSSGKVPENKEGRQAL